ncbi:DUF1572 family protein [Virgibacillus pantothenticus]|uniref:DUF1572 family protein n=1 Tax=Virgibacillus pantothenticus TaxID=1473 RepID=UPI00095753C7|nr:Protein of unknown function [Virgibacillus pantothenticus]
MRKVVIYRRLTGYKIPNSRIRGKDENYKWVINSSKSPIHSTNNPWGMKKTPREVSLYKVLANLIYEKGENAFMELGNIYLQVIKRRFAQIKEQGDGTFEQLDETDIHWTFNEASNSIAVIVKHMRGNMLSRWTNFLTTDGEKSNRHRDQEFINTIQSKQELLTVWNEGWSVLFDALEQISAEDLRKHVKIREQPILVLEAVERQLAHYASHVGQIVYIGKQLKGNEWKSLSIPKGNSAEYLQQMKQRYGK